MNHEQEHNPEEESNSLIRLSLRKPKEWNWSLDTSLLSSSSTIIFPAIQLWDEEEGNLLVDTRHQDLCNATALCITQNTMQSLKLPSLKLSNLSTNSRLKCQEFETDNNPKRRIKTLSYRSKRDDHFGSEKNFQQKIPVSVNRSDSISKDIKIENEVKTSRTLPHIHRWDLHVQPQSDSKLKICSSVDRRKELKTKHDLNLESNTLTYLSHRIRKDLHESSNSNIQQTNVERVTLRNKSKIQNYLKSETTKRNVPDASKGNGCESESNVKQSIPVSVAKRAIKTAKDLQDIKTSPRTNHKHFEKTFQPKLPTSVSQKSLLKKPNSKRILNHEDSATNLSHRNRSDKQELPKTIVQPTATSKMSFNKELKLENTKKAVDPFTLVSSKYGHFEPKTYFKPSDGRKQRLSKNLKIENDLQKEDTLSCRNLRKQHEELENNVQLNTVRRTSNESKTVNTMRNYNTVPKTKLFLRSSEIKTHEQLVRNTKKKLESNVKPILSLEGIDGKDNNATQKPVLKGKLHNTRIANYSSVNDKSVKYILCKSEPNSSKDLSGIPVKKSFTSTGKFIKGSFNDRSIDSSIDSTIRKSRKDVDFVEKSTHNRLDISRPDKRSVRKINNGIKLQQVDYKTNRIQKSVTTSIPLPTTFKRKEKKVQVTNKSCSCYQEDDGVFNKRCSTKNKKKVFRKRVPYHGDLSSSSSESELIILWDHQHLRKRRSENIKGDRLLGINGQCVRHPQVAGDLLRQSGDVVSLQLARNGVGSQSLPRYRVESPHEIEDYEMGSNVSRHSGKGLTGRRSQSSGNLCNGKIMRPSVGRFFSPCSRSGVDNSVGPRDRYKFCGSLPNHLDSKDPVLDEMSETDDDSSYRNNNNVPVINHQIKNKKNVELRLHPLVSKGTQHGHQDSVTNDQGYASERSPEDEVPPSMVGTCPVHHKPVKHQYPIITKNSTFTVTLQKGTRGLGLSVTGGIETDERWPGLIRIKRLFPHQPAWQSGHLAHGDILIAANNTPLTGLTNYEALEVLRTTPTEVVLTVCRAPPEIQLLNAPPSTDTAPAPPKRDPTSSSGLLLPLKRQESFGEFEITLKKVSGSLGFTLRKEDESVLGHYVRALVKEPALSDGRIKPGDKIVAVNNVPMSPMSHEEAVMFLRQCDEEVHLKLFRDPVQTPILALSPTEAHRTFKPILRKEAQDMLSDLAVKKSLSPNDSTGSSTLSRLGRSSSPRKRRLTKTPSPDDQLNGGGPLSWSNEVLERILPGNDSDKPCRPDSLNLYAKRKPHFQFASTVIVTEETGLSSDELDGTSQNQIVEEAESPVGVGPLPSEPVSMPPVLSSSSTGGFSYRNPAYRSANPSTTKSKGSMCEELPENRCSDNDLSGNASGGVEGSKSLLKWKGVVFSPEDRTNSITSPEDSISQITETDEGCNNQVLVIELMRGWNSRLGFSLQQVGPNTVISAIHPDSVASRDGRLKPGDQLIMVNDESVERMSTSDVIDLLRRIRGVICITVWRKLKD